MVILPVSFPDYKISLTVSDTCAFHSLSPGSLTATAGPRHNFVIAGVCLFMNFSNPAESDWTSHGEFHNPNITRSEHTYIYIPPPPVLTILGAGQYDFIKPTICTISPKITTAEVSYYSSPPLMINVSRTISARDPPGGGVVAGISIQAFIKRLGLAQSLWDNGIGDALASVYRSRAESVDGDAGQKEELVNVLLVSWKGFLLLLHNIPFQALMGLPLFLHYRRATSLAWLK